MDGPRVTDFQLIVIYFSAVTAVFLGAMAWGWQNLWLLVAALAVLGVAVVSVIVVVVRRGAGMHEIATAQVISVSSPPHNVGIAARCDMQLEVRLAGRPPVRTRHRDPAVPLTRWPQPGQTFPVDVFGGNPRRRLHIRWDLVEQGMVRAPDATSGAATSPTPIWEEENEPVVYSPTPPRRRPQAPPPPPGPSVDPPPSAAETAVFLHETFTDIDEVPATSVRTPPPPVANHPADAPPSPTQRSGDGDPNGHDPDGYDPADFETPRLTATPADAATGGPDFEAVALSEFDPAEVDIRDFTDEAPAVTIMPTDDETGPVTAPDPPATDGAPAAPADPPPHPIPLPRDPDGAVRGGTGISTTLTVADLARSVRFYRDALGFTVAFASSDSAVVEHRGTRILLEVTQADPNASDDIHIDVADIEASCAAVEEHAGEVVEAPTPSATGAGRRLWRARLHDPDGHTVELMQWRQRDG